MARASQFTRRVRLFQAAGCLAFVLLAASPAAAQIPDDALGARVVAAVQHCPTFGIFDDINIGVRDRTVTISGSVTDASKREDIARRAGHVDGIRVVVNSIVVLPMTPGDIALRQRVARAIYGNALFWRYASSANPPIHIIVTHGRVRLTGAVSDETERSFAFALAHVSGALSVGNELRVGHN